MFQLFKINSQFKKGDGKFYIYEIFTEIPDTEIPASDILRYFTRQPFNIIIRRLIFITAIFRLETHNA